MHIRFKEIINLRVPYDYIKNKYDSKSKLLFTDTDSVTYEMKTEDVYGDFSNDKEMLISVIIELSQNTMIIERN